MKKFPVLLLVLIPALLLVFVNVVYSAPRAKLQAFPTPIPFISFPLFLDTEVVIPDPALHQRLHAETGIPESDPIYTSSLAALSGSLFLDNCGIANAEGLQYCTNVEYISLTNNSLSSLPDCSGMTGLKWISLDDNGFTSVPSGLFGAPHLEKIVLHSNPVTSVADGITDMTALKELDLTNTSLHSFPYAVLTMNIEVLRLDNAPINSIPSDIDSMTHLKELYAANTQLESLPSALYTMSQIETLELGSNGIESISPSISGMTNLTNLGLNGNKLESLPDSICSLNNLQILTATYNNLYSLPAHIGDHIGFLAVRANRITSIPDSVIHSPTMYVFDVSINRLTSLPSDFDETTAFDIINVEYNFLDVSAGSHDRELIHDNPSFDKYYERQLTPVKDLTAVPSPDSVTLSWSACLGGSGDGATWTVKGYVVYQYTGELVKLEDLNPSQLTYTHTGLTPETAYTYRVGVDYRIIDPALEDDLVTRGYTQTETTTLALGSSETMPTAPPVISMEASAEVSADTTGAVPAAKETAESAPESKDSLPIWAIIIAAVGALGIIGTGAAIAILKLRKPKA